MRLLLQKIRDRFRRGRLAAELDQELRFHRGMLERDASADGHSTEEARQMAQRRLGNVTGIREDARDAWSLGLFDDLLLDVRYAARALRRTPGFTSAVTLTLALGIGVNTAIFSVVHAVLLTPLPYANPERLVSVWMAPAAQPSDRNPASLPEVLDWRAQNDVFTDIGAYAFNRFELTGPEGVDEARAIIGTPMLYSVLGAPVLAGRLPSATDERVAVVAISYRLWRQRFGGAASVVGKTLVLNEQPYTIIGIMGRGFHFPSPDIDLWMSLYPLAGAPGQPATSPWITNRRLHGYRVVARLKPGIKLPQAERSMNALQQRMGTVNPQADAGMRLHLQQVADDALGGVRRPLWLMLGAAAMVLLLACVNVAHLLLARTAGRTREIALRRALGAGRPRVTRQLLTESMLLALVGGAIGVIVAAVATRALIRMSPADIPRLENVTLDGSVLLFALIASAMTGLLFGVMPAVTAWDGGLQGTLREEGRGVQGGRRTGRVRAVLTSAEVAFALMLLVGAGLMVRSFTYLLSIDPGFRTDGVATFHVGLAAQRYPAPTDQTAGIDRILAKLRSLPGVASVGGSTSLPPVRMQQASAFSIEGDPAPEPGHLPTATYIPATPGYLEALRIGVTRGRSFTSADDAKGPLVAIVNAELARRYFGARDPLGHRINIDTRETTIIGVADNAPYEGIGVAPKPEVYVPFAQSPFAGVWFALHATANASALFPAIRDAVRSVDPQINVRDLRMLDQLVDDSLVRPRFQTWLLGTFGALALALAAVGIYGVVAYGVSQRTAEIGMRLALGAQRHNVITLVVGGGMRPVVAGLIAGVVGAVALSRLMAGLLYGIQPTDVLTFTVVTAILATVAALASYVPAARAANVDPIVALRNE